MTNKEESTTRVLSIYPNTVGFGFAVFEGADNPIDWGVKTIKERKNDSCLDQAEKLIDFYAPDVVVTKDYDGKKPTQSKRIGKLIDEITGLCGKKNQKLVKYPRSSVNEAFEVFSSLNKHEIAQTIARWHPTLVPYLPPQRKPWKAEDYRMGIFDSVALILTYFYREE